MRSGRRLVPIVGHIQTVSGVKIGQHFIREIPEPEVDEQIRMTAATGYVKAGIWTPDEGREASGKEPMGGAAAELMIITPTGPIPLEEALELAAYQGEREMLERAAQRLG